MEREGGWLGGSHVMERCQKNAKGKILGLVLVFRMCFCWMLFSIHHSRGLQQLIGCLDVCFSMHVCTGRCADGLKLKDNCPTLCQFLSFALFLSSLWALYRCCSLNSNPTTSSKFYRGCSRSFQAVPRMVRGTLPAVCAVPWWGIQATSAGQVTVR